MGKMIHALKRRGRPPPSSGGKNFFYLLGVFIYLYLVQVNITYHISCLIPRNIWPGDILVASLKTKIMDKEQGQLSGSIDLQINRIYYFVDFLDKFG